MSTKGSKPQPARQSERIGGRIEYETREFAQRRDKNRRKRDLAKAARKRNRK
jgi:hypothetical protein